MADPTQFSPYNNVGVSYSNIKEYKIARPYLLKAIELNPKCTTSYHSLGFISMTIDNEPDKAIKFWRDGLANGDECESKATCAEDMAITHINRDEFAQAAYFSRWSICTSKETQRMGMRRSMFSKAAVNLNDVQVMYIRDKTDNFSLADLDKFIVMKTGADREKAAATAATEKYTRKSVGAEKPATEKSAAGKIASESAATKEAASGKQLELPSAITERINETLALPLPGIGDKKVLPEVPDCVKVVYGGAYVALHFRMLKRLGIFNPGKMDFEFFIPTDGEGTLFCPSGENLVLYRPKANVFEKWSLTKTSKLSARPAHIVGVPTVLESGIFYPSRAIISYSEGAEPSSLDERVYAFFDLNTFQIIQATVSGDKLSGRFRDKVNLRVDTKFRAFVEWKSGLSPSGVIYGAIDGDKLNLAYAHDTCGALSLTDDLQLIIGSCGRVLRPYGLPREENQGNHEWYRAVCGDSIGNLYGIPGTCQLLRLYNRTIETCNAENCEPVAKFELPISVKVVLPRFKTQGIPDDQLVVPLPALRRLLLVDVRQPAFYSFPLNGTAALGMAALVTKGEGGAVRGQRWTKNLGYPDGTQVKVIDAPKGVFYDTVTGSLIWQITDDTFPGEKAILLSVTLAGKEEQYQKVTLTVK